MNGLQWDDQDPEPSVLCPDELLRAINDGSLTNLDGSSSGVFGVPRLIEACQNNIYDSARILLEHGASPDITHTHGNTALHYLFQSGQTDSPLVPLLIENQADVVLQNVDGIPAFAFCPPHRLNGFTALMNTRVRDNAEYFILTWPSFKKGIKEANKINSRYASWMSQFYLRVDPSCASQLPAIVTQRHSNPYVRCVQDEDVHAFANLVCQQVEGLNQPDTDGMTPLHHAVQGNSTKMVKLLCRNPRIQIDRMVLETPLHLAVREGHHHLALILLESSADPCLPCSFEEHQKQHFRMEYKEETPMHMAARYGQLDCLTLLLQYAPQASLIDNRFGNLPLHIAAMNGFVEGVRALLENELSRSRIDYQNTRGDTPLHYAYRHANCEEVISLFRLFGADESITNNRGQVPSSASHQTKQKRRQRHKPRGRGKQQKARPQGQPKKATAEKASVSNLSDSGFDPSCVVCLDEAKNVLFIPCKHIATCGTCAHSLLQCPLCRQDIVDRMTVFIS